MILKTGTRLAQYELLAAIGAGGMGQVYRARDERLGRDVAIKVLAERFAQDPDMRGRFQHEAQALASLSHPAIVVIYELALVHDLPFVVMELLEGETLRARLSRGALDWRAAVRIGEAVAEGLAAAHGKGIVHRDIKPENIFVTTDGRVKILDFGLVKRTSLDAGESLDLPTLAETLPGTLLGTPGYMSPEQLEGGQVDARTDIFALGCILHEAISGSPPFPGRTLHERIAAVIRDSPPVLRTHDDAMPTRVAEIVRHCLQKAPERRFQSAGDLAAALQSASSDSQVLSSPAPQVGSAPRRGRRSLAVLPFENTGGDVEMEYISDGITEGIINTLSQVPKLRIVPRGLVFRYKGRAADTRTLAMTLNAAHLLTGRVARHGDTLRVQTELVDTATEAQVWGEQFNVPLAQLSMLQHEIAPRISEALRIRLTREERQRIGRRRRHVPPEAYHHFLRGRYYWNQWSEEAFKKSLECFEQAVEHDPTFAPGYAGMAQAFGILAYHRILPPTDALPRARAAALRAVQLDDQLPDAHAILAMARMVLERNWPEAKREFTRALELDPKHPLAHFFYGLFQCALLRPERGLEHLQLAQQLDPLSRSFTLSVAWGLYFCRRYNEAVDQARRAYELMPGFDAAHGVIVQALERQGEYIRAADALVKYTNTIDAASLLDAYRADGAPGYWRIRAGAMTDMAHRHMPSLDQATVYAQAGQIDRGIEVVRRMVDDHEGGAIFLRVEPGVDPLRSDPRFQALVQRVGFPDEPKAAPRALGKQ